MKITDIRYIRVEGTVDRPIGIDDGRGLVPADNDPAFAARPFKPLPWAVDGPDGTRPIANTFVVVETDEGISGTATQTLRETCEFIERRLKPWMIGRDPRKTEENWDFLFRLCGGRRLGPASLLDSAMWDIRGKIDGVPVYELLGGPGKDRIRPYAGTAGRRFSLENVRTLGVELVEAGFSAQKWYPPYCPGHGADSREKNLELMRALRKTVGEDVEIMFDAHQGWTREYAVEMAERMRPIRPRWLEEPVMCDDIAGYKAVRDAAGGFPIAGSEAYSNRWQFESMLRADAVDVLQPEAGGITELMRVAKLTADHGKQMAVHCGYTPILHVVAALPESICPYYEYLVNWHEYGEWFYREKHPAVDGWIELPEGPGLGLTLDDNRIERRVEVTF